MRIHFLGSGGYHPSERRHTACAMLPELGLMIDAGTGAFRAAKHVATDRLDVVLTHAHLDHVVGLTYLLALERRGERVRVVVHGSEQTLDAVRSSMLDPRLFPIQPVDAFELLGDHLRLPSGAEVTTFPLDHPGGSLGLRIEANGKSLAYITDTTEIGEATIEQIRGADLLVHEAYFTEEQRDFARKTGHSTAHQAATAAVAAGAKELVLIHCDPRAEEEPVIREARQVFAGARLAEDGMMVDV